MRNNELVAYLAAFGLMCAGAMVSTIIGAIGYVIYHSLIYVICN